MKFFVGLFLFLISLGSWASNIPTEQKELFLVWGQEYQVAKPAMGGYGVIHDGLSKVRIENNKAIITATGVGKSVIQILHTDGTITNYIIKSTYDFNKSGVNDKNALAKGYNFIVSADYSNSQSRGQAKDVQRTSLRGRAVLTTKLGTKGKFYGMVEGQENYPTYFYVQGNYQKVYLGYGDKTIPLNDYRPSFITQPRLRQQTAGWDGDQFDLDFWSGQISPVPSFTTGLDKINNPANMYLISSEQDRFSGAHFNYKFKQDSLYGSVWYNHLKQRQIPYLGYTYKNYDLGIVNSFTMGNTPEAPVFSNDLTYEAHGGKGWTIQRAQLNYEKADAGFDTLLFSSKLPVEKLGVSAQFYSENKFSTQGSSFLTLGYNHNLTGYILSNSYSTGLGWQNSRVLVGADGILGDTEYSYASGKYKNYTLNPKIELWLNKPTETWRWKVGVTQSFNHVEYPNGNNDKNDSKITIYTKHKSGVSLSLGVGRYSSQNATSDRTGVRFTPRAEYRKENVSFFAQGNISYVDKSYGNNSVPNNTDSGYVLGQERYSAGLRYTLNQKHIFDARYVLADDAISNRGYSYMSLGYTLKLGSQTKSIISLFDSKKVWGTIYQDKNLNGIQDKDEQGIKDLIVKVVSDRGGVESTRTDNEGYYKISGLKDETYSLSIEGSEDYTLSSAPGSLNFKTQEGYKYDLPAIKTHSVTIDLKGETDDIIMAVVNCDDKPRFNKAQVLIGQENILTVPSENKCSVSLELMGQSNMSILPDKISTTESKMHFTAKSSRILLGQLYWDKNFNGIYDIGEEIIKQQVVFDKLAVITDSNGIFTSKIDNKITKIKFIKVPGFVCSIKNSIIEDFSISKIHSISCQKQ